MSNAKVRAAIDADRRLVILRLLVEYQGALSTVTVESGLRAYRHLYISRALVNDDFRWLEALHLVKTEEIAPQLLGVAITPRGERVARGEEWVDGVSRPGGD